jgi:hypothetical protein
MAKPGLKVLIPDRSDGRAPFGGAVKKPWNEPGPEGRKGVIAFSRTRSKIVFGCIEE